MIAAARSTISVLQELIKALYIRLLARGIASRPSSGSSTCETSTTTLVA
jgi:hypothetical protein